MQCVERGGCGGVSVERGLLESMVLDGCDCPDIFDDKDEVKNACLSGV